MTIVGITGHQNLPPEAVTLVKETLPRLLASLSADLVMSSLAAGADQLCADIAHGAGVPISVVIPCKAYESTFDKDSLVRYIRLLGRSRSAVTLDFDEPSEEAFYEAGKAVATKCDVLIAVWDGEAAAGLGGTGDVVAFAKDLGKTAKVLWPQGVSR